MMNKSILTIANNIKTLRHKSHWTQEQLAQRAGISYNTLIKIESGRIKNPSVDTAYKIARALGTTIDRLLKKR